MQATRGSSVDLDVPPVPHGDVAAVDTGGGGRPRADSDGSSITGGGGGFATPTPKSSRPTGRVRTANTGRRRFLPTYKIVLLGDSAVGKSNLMARFAKGHFDALSRATIGMEFVSREVDLSCTAPSLADNFHDFLDDGASSSHAASGRHSPMSGTGHAAASNAPSPVSSSHHQDAAAGGSAGQHERVLSGDLSLSGGGALSALQLPAGGTGGGGRSGGVSPGASSSAAASALGMSTASAAAAAGGSGGGFSDRILLQLWDTAGQEANAALSAVYYRGARGVAVAYDVTRRETLYNVGRWVASARRHCDESVVICVIGNKTDLKHSVAVPEEEARDFCHSLGCRHYVASAMNGEGVEHAFLQLLLAVHAEATVRGVVNELPNGAESMRRRGSRADDRGSSATLDGGDTIAGFRLTGSGGASKKKRPCCP